MLLRLRLAHVKTLIPALFAAALLSPSCNQGAKEESVEKPEDNRFTKVVLTEGMDEPMAMTFLKDGKVLIAERKGQVKSFNTKTKEFKTIANIPVNTKYTSKEGVVSEAEEGLVGITVNPDFENNHWVYTYYADPQTPNHILARWELKGDSLDASSKKIVLQVPTQREVCCHTGGGMAWDKAGNLYLTVGNNTANPASGAASYDERPGRSSWDDQRGSGSTNDLRGKILRIHPEADGSYTIPEGNLFPKGTPKTKPEIFVMGDRNPWRVSVDSKTGYVYWGEVGPDASVDSVYGSRGYDEFNQARKAGNFGWPYFIGDNRPYNKYNYADSSYGEKFDPVHPLNRSPNNTGLTELPPAQKPLIWYPYGISDSFPMLGSAGRSAVGGPVFHKDDFRNAVRPWPAYFENKWLITDFMRGWLMAVRMDEEGNYQSMERILPDQNFSSVIDMQFGPDGDMYFLEYGSSWFRGNANSALVRIEYNAGNRKPIVEAAADKSAGAIPFTVKLSSKGTTDYDSYDRDKLKYDWTIVGNGITKASAEPDPSIVLDKPGSYTATLTVTDSRGAKNSRSIQLNAGNEPPTVSIQLLKGNKSFFFPGQPIDYAIAVNDKEDGTIGNGQLKREDVAVNFDYLPEGFDPIEIAQHHRAADDASAFSAGKYLISTSDCQSCHALDKTSVGPSFQAIAGRYANEPGTVSKLSLKVIQGGSGVWGEHAMSAHPHLSVPNAEAMVRYILSSATPAPQARPLPLAGTFIPSVPAGENGKGSYLLRVAYADKGAGGAGSQAAEMQLPLRNPSLDPQKADIQQSTQLLTTPSISFSMLGDGSYIGYKKLDLTGIRQIQMLVQASPNNGAAGGVIEIHLDSPGGELVGQTAMVESKPIDFARLMENMGGGKGKAAPKPKAAPPAGSGDKKKQAPAFDFSMLRKLLSTQASAALKPTEGMHDLYFVFRNKDAKKGQPLMQVVEINFMNQAVAVK